MDNFQEFGWEDTIENEGSEFVLLPEGDYDFTVKSFERSRHNGSDKMPPCNMAKVTVTVWGQQDKLEITENFFLCNKMEWKLSQFFLSIGLKKHGEPLKMNWNEVSGKHGKCHIYVDNFKNKNGEDRQSNKIKKFYAYDEQVTTLSPKSNPPQQTYQQPAAGGWKPGSF